MLFKLCLFYRSKRFKSCVFVVVLQVRNTGSAQSIGKSAQFEIGMDKHLYCHSK